MTKKIDVSAGELVRMIKRGDLRLPEMQRRYVWKANQVRDLLDSLYRDYPTGTVLVWETRERPPERDFAVGQDANQSIVTKLLLDGQQRLTSLTSLFNAEPVSVRRRRRPIELLFNLDHPEDISEELTSLEDYEESSLDDGDYLDEEDDEDTIQDKLSKRTFVVHSKALESISTWVKVTDIFNHEMSESKILKKIGLNSDDPLWDKYSDRIRKVKNIEKYPFVMYVIGEDKNYEEVAEIFVRVNSSGTKLRGSDLALAQITAKWKNSLKIFDDYIETCSEKGRALDVGLLARSIVVFATKQCRFKTVASIPLEKLQEGWKKSEKSLDFALNFLQSNAYVESLSLLSSPYFVLPIALFAELKDEDITKEDEVLLKKWLYVAHAKGHYSKGSSESILDSDLRILYKGGGPKDLLDSLEGQFGVLDLSIRDFAGKGIRSSYFSLSYIALKKQEAKDWFSNITIALNHQGKRHSIQYHHIFPKARLVRAGYAKSEINDLANMGFLGGRTNRRISAKNPSEYLSEIVEKQGREALIEQCVPIDPKLWEIENYLDFLTERRSLLLTAIKKNLKL